MTITHQSLRPAVVLGELQASVSNSGGVYERGNFCHMGQTELVENARISIPKLAKIYILLDIRTLRSKLGEATKEMYASIESGRGEPTSKLWAQIGYNLGGR